MQPLLCGLAGDWARPGQVGGCGGERQQLACPLRPPASQTDGDNLQLSRPGPACNSSVHGRVIAIRYPFPESRNEGGLPDSSPSPKGCSWCRSASTGGCRLLSERGPRSWPLPRALPSLRYRLLCISAVAICTNRTDHEAPRGSGHTTATKPILSMTGSPVVTC